MLVGLVVSMFDHRVVFGDVNLTNGVVGLVMKMMIVKLERCHLTARGMDHRNIM